jgi:hypothetical protein
LQTKREAIYFPTPQSIHNALVLEEESKEFIYLDQIRFVNSVKSVKPIPEHPLFFSSWRWVSR